MRRPGALLLYRQRGNGMATFLPIKRGVQALCWLVRCGKPRKREQGGGEGTSVQLSAFNANMRSTLLQCPVPASKGGTVA